MPPLKVTTNAPTVLASNPNQTQEAQQKQVTPGQSFAQYYQRLRTQQGNPSWEVDQRTDLIQDIASKSGNQIDVNKYGIVKDTKAPDLNAAFELPTKRYTDMGALATQAEEERSAFRQRKQLEDLLKNFNVTNEITAQLPDAEYQQQRQPNYTGPGSNTTGGKAVDMAMQVYKNKVPYVWGGNSLTQGVDCSGLVQQIYAKLGVKLPRTTYEQAKSGRTVPMNQLQPGDLLFYNTGASDPNGIGTYSHVAIYAGNGQIIEARGRQYGVQFGPMRNPTLAVRPY